MKTRSTSFVNREIQIKTIMGHYIPIRIAKNKTKTKTKHPTQKVTNASEDAGQQLSCREVGNAKRAVTLEDVLGLNRDLLLPGTCPRTLKTSAHLKIYVQICMHMNTIAKIWKEPSSPSEVRG